jgi:hypothetical protein
MGMGRFKEKKREATRDEGIFSLVQPSFSAGPCDKSPLPSPRAPA